MIFEKKIDRAMDWLKNQNKDVQVKESLRENESSKEVESSVVDESSNEEDALIDNDIDLKMESRIKEEIEKNDLLAIFIAALLMFTPVILLVLGMFVLLAYIFF